MLPSNIVITSEGASLHFLLFLFFQYSHKWEPGDFIISDNLAVGHEASPETQYPRSKVGLRVMHRVTIAGKVKPKK